LKQLKSRFEYEEFGGGPLLGIRGACIICHGASGTRAIKNAVRVAHAMAQDRLNSRIIEQLGAKVAKNDPEEESDDGSTAGAARGEATA
jgi:glycerol-3-phosphate acyltransferase PlsX